MKALMYTAPNEVQLQDIPEPQIRPGAVKIRVDYCAICATDVHIVTHGLYGIPTPWPLGHEGSGTVVEVSDEAAAQGWKVGDKAAVGSMSYCGTCENCRRGDEAHCQNMFVTPLLTEYAVIPTNMVFKIPEHEDVKNYCILEPTTSALRGIDLAQIKQGDSVLISGVGGLGAILLNMILNSGATKVTAIDINEDKLTRAKEMGAKYVINPLKEDIVEQVMKITNGRGFDVIIEASGSPSAAPPMLKCVASRGKIVYFAVYPTDYELPLNLYDLYNREASIHTVFTSMVITPRAMDMIPQLQLDKILGPVYSLDDAVEAFWTYDKAIYPKIIVKCSNL